VFSFLFPGERLILQAIAAIARNQEIIMGELDTLKTEVSETTTVMASAVTLLQGLKQKLDEAIASGNPEALAALSAELDTNTNALAQAITENTPAEGQARARR